MKKIIQIVKIIVTGLDFNSILISYYKKGKNSTLQH